MAITKVTRNMLTTGIVDNSNATAITIDSSENVNFVGDITLTKTGTNDAGIKFVTANANRYIASDENGVVSIGTGTTLTGGTQYLTIDSGNVGIGETSPTANLHIKGTGGGDGVNMILHNTGNAPAGIRLLSGHGNYEVMASKTVADALEFIDDSAGVTRMLINSSGNVGIGTTSPAQLLHVETTASPIATFRYNSSNRVDVRYDGLDTYGGNFRMMLEGTERFRFGTGVLGVSTTTLAAAGDNPADENSSVLGAGYLYLQRDDSASINQIVFGKNGQIAGRVITTTATSYLSASDYRMKENVDYTWDATTRLKQLKPARYNWIADETNTLEDGFLAHEVSSVVPNAVFGEKDAVDSDGNPEMQGVDSAKLIPLLVKTIQELEARITTLEG